MRVRGYVFFNFLNIYFGAVYGERLVHSGSMNHLFWAVLLKIKVSLWFQEWPKWPLKGVNHLKWPFVFGAFFPCVSGSGFFWYLQLERPLGPVLSEQPSLERGSPWAVGTQGPSWCVRLLAEGTRVQPQWSALQHLGSISSSIVSRLCGCPASVHSQNCPLLHGGQEGSGAGPCALPASRDSWWAHGHVALGADVFGFVAADHGHCWSHWAVLSVGFVDVHGIADPSKGVLWSQWSLQVHLRGEMLLALESGILPYFQGARHLDKRSLGVVASSPVPEPVRSSASEESSSLSSCIPWVLITRCP